MKKPYIIPSQIVYELHTGNMMAVSIQGGTADPNAEVLGKENNDWYYYDDEDTNPIKDVKFF